MKDQEFGFRHGRYYVFNRYMPVEIVERFSEELSSKLRLKNELMVIYDEHESVLYTLK